MLGGDVTFSVRQEHIHQLPKIKSDVTIIHKLTKDADFIVPDSREGWVELLRRFLSAYLVTGKGFSYSTILIRSYGEKINGFGGTASGPQILIDGLENITKVLKNREGKKLRSIDILDIGNIIGSIVVAGNVRRTAELALGDADDILFLRAKRWDLGNIPNWRAMSNNTIAADSYDYTSPEFWKGYNGDGEPYGLFNLELSQNYGRLIDGPMNKCKLYPQPKDNCEGTNPCCFSINSYVEVIRRTDLGYEHIDIKKVKSNDLIWIDNERGWGKTTRGYFNTGKLPVYELNMIYQNTVVYFKVTGNHKFETDENQLITVDELIERQKLMLPCNIRWGERATINPTCEKLSNNYAQITTIYLVGEEETGCIDIENHHRFWANNVISGNSEISLASGESCNLSELFLNNISSLEELIDCAKLLYKTQKAICAMNYLHDKTTKIVHKNMRLGIGITGICQSFDKLKWLDSCYKALRKFDKEWSKERGWNESIKLTTTKPSGTLSLLGGSTPGVHPGFDKYYIRRVRMSSLDKLVEICKNLGYHTEYARTFDGANDHKTIIVEFPCSCEDAIIATQMTAIQQLELVKKIQTDWADNAVSVTVYYRLNELDGIKKWLQENYKTSLKCVSFLLHSDHNFAQVPYESIPKDKYLELMTKVKPFTLNTLKDTGGSIDMEECAGGACPVK
jgi:hypothetical protein